MLGEWGTPAVLLTIISSASMATMWINKQFSTQKALLYIQFEKLLDRLESHEKHDNARFSDVNNHMWELRLDNARNKEDRKTLRSGMAREEGEGRG